MKIALWSLLTLFLIAGAIGGLLAAANAHNTPDTLRHLLAATWFALGAWGSWRRASRPHPTELTPAREPHGRLWRRR
ncbi:hypothetical protein [Streptomyces antibioticus]|uniref:Uncharacterized protein n=1 Tax=Streptomyces antibioticus TaxID=1890 RepID=A0AAE6Y923_STRAT|nr:hypothetical protein [Streptomyces antibioticus]QIT45780.1 hypothetical protein HCX60_21480 [Streptomyces antibioticus]